MTRQILLGIRFFLLALFLTVWIPIRSWGVCNLSTLKPGEWCDTGESLIASGVLEPCVSGQRCFGVEGGWKWLAPGVFCACVTRGVVSCCGAGRRRDPPSGALVPSGSGEPPGEPALGHAVARPPRPVAAPLSFGTRARRGKRLTPRGPSDRSPPAAACPLELALDQEDCLAAP